MSSPMQRSLALYRERGWEPWIVERWLPRAKVRVDLYGLGDFIALKSGERPHLVQTTVGDRYADHYRKIEAAEHLSLVLEHFDVVLHAWRPLKIKRGGKAIRYELREAEFTAESVAVQELGEVPA